jgi:hypothetical protein
VLFVLNASHMDSMSDRPSGYVSSPQSETVHTENFLAHSSP